VTGGHVGQDCAGQAGFKEAEAFILIQAAMGAFRAEFLPEVRPPKKTKPHLI
jgi:hypothetical protein